MKLKRHTDGKLFRHAPTQRLMKIREIPDIAGMLRAEARAEVLQAEWLLAQPERPLGRCGLKPVLRSRKPLRGFHVLREVEPIAQG